MKVTFELSDKDLRHFKRVMREAREKAKDRPESQLIDSARQLLAQVREAPLPSFIESRLMQLETMIGMLEDSEWKLTGNDRERVSSALAYFDEPMDLIPDAVPGFGFLDDAVMVELVVRDLKHDIDAFSDFCNYRKTETKRRGTENEISRDEWIAAKRNQLHQRMRRRRRSRSRASARGSRTRSPFSLW
ncbi:MAG: YkvA family protein [Myxococcota bacterium]